MRVSVGSVCGRKAKWPCLQRCTHNQDGSTSSVGYLAASSRITAAGMGSLPAILNESRLVVVGYMVGAKKDRAMLQERKQEHVRRKKWSEIQKAEQLPCAQSPTSEHFHPRHQPETSGDIDSSFEQKMLCNWYTFSYKYSVVAPCLGSTRAALPYPVPRPPADALPTLPPPDPTPSQPSSADEPDETPDTDQPSPPATTTPATSRTAYPPPQ